MSNPEFLDKLNESVIHSHSYTRVKHYREYLNQFPKNISQYINTNLWRIISRSIKDLNNKDITENTIKLILAKQKINKYDGEIDKILNKIQNPDPDTLISLTVRLKDGSLLNKTIGDLLTEYYSEIETIFTKEFPGRCCFFNVFYLTGKIVDLVPFKYELSDETIDNLITLKTMVKLDHSMPVQKILNMDKQFNHILPLLIF